MEVTESKKTKSLEEYEDDEDIIPVPEDSAGPKKRKRDKNRSKQLMAIEIKLSPRELIDRKVQAFKLLADAEDVRAQYLKAVKALKPFRDKLRDYEKEIRKQTQAISAEKEVREVEVEIITDVFAGVVDIYYLGKLHKEMPLLEFKRIREERINAAKDVAQTDLFESGPARGQAAKR